MIVNFPTLNEIDREFQEINNKTRAWRNVGWSPEVGGNVTGGVFHEGASAG